MVLAETVGVIFGFLVGLGFLWLGIERRGFVWAFLSVIVFTACTVTGAAIPYNGGAGGPVNILFSGLGLLLAFVGIAYSLQFAFEIFSG